MEFGYVMKHLHKIKATFISIFSLNTDLFEMLDQTLFLVFDLLRKDIGMEFGIKKCAMIEMKRGKTF